MHSNSGERLKRFVNLSCIYVLIYMYYMCITIKRANNERSSFTSLLPHCSLIPFSIGWYSVPCESLSTTSKDWLHGVHILSFLNNGKKLILLPVCLSAHEAPSKNGSTPKGKKKVDLFLTSTGRFMIPPNFSSCHNQS